VDRVTRPGKARATPPQAEPPRSPGPDDHQRPVSSEHGSAPSVQAGPEREPGQAGQRTSPRPARDTSPRSALSRIASHPRLPLWERRIAVALVAGIVFTLLFDWRIGLTAAVLAAIADSLQRAHSTSLIPASRSAAQRRTERRLGRLGGAGYLTLNERAIPGSDNVIDHLVIGPAGVHAIDSERWDKRLPVRVIKQKQLWHGPFSQKDRLIEARWEAQQASELISGSLGRHVDVRPSLAIYGPKIPWHVLTIRDVDVYTGNEVRKYLRYRAKLNRGRRLSQADAEQIFDAADQVLPARY
jgi:Nuclease-related domain